MSRRQASNHDIGRQLSAWTARRVLAWLLFGLAAVVAGQHLLAHAGLVLLPFGMGKQDLFTGYPTAFLLGLGAAFVADPRPRL